MRALVAGWFSFRNGTATGGDLLAAEVVCGWLRRANLPYDVAVAPPFAGGVSYDQADPAAYSHAVFVCGPFGDGTLDQSFLRRFAACHLIGLDLSLPFTRDAWNPFDVLIERDTPATANPELAFASNRPLVPVVGLCLVDSYHGADTQSAGRALRSLVAGREVAVVEIDTRLDENRFGMRSASEIESLLARMDVVLTTRLHGMVLALKNGVPALAVDPEPGGAKIMRQARTIGWPYAWSVDTVSKEALESAFDACLTVAARDRTHEISAAARARIAALETAFLSALAQLPLGSPDRSRQTRAQPVQHGPRAGAVIARLRRMLRPIKGAVRGAIAGAAGGRIVPRARQQPIVIRFE
jgi:hypothetical protein